jgi:tRNA-2-methylthio-N6-dimethylallyladenosine synthase
MADQVPDEVKALRNTRLLEVTGRVAAARSLRLEGRTLPVLVDGVSRKNAGEAAGRTRCNRVVNFDTGGRDLLGRVVEVRIARALPHSLRGELVDASGNPGAMDRLPVGLAEPALPA